MEHVKNSPFYHEAIQELNYPFGNFYLFESFIVGEVNEGVVFTWEYHAKMIVEEVSNLYENNGKDLVYISNRVYSYAVKPSDWLKFYKSDFKLRAYAIVSYTSRGALNTIVEKLFMKNRIKSFENLTDAITWSRKLSIKKEIAS